MMKAIVLEVETLGNILGGSIGFGKFNDQWFNIILEVDVSTWRIEVCLAAGVGFGLSRL